MKGEKWMDIKDFEGLYQVSNMGRVLSKKTNKIRKPSISAGYYQVHLSSNYKVSYKTVHRLVAQSFIPNHKNKPQVNHKNGIKTDNRTENLEWCTVSENHKHAFRTGLRDIMKGELNSNSKLNRKDIIIIRRLRKEKKTIDQIADMFNISRSHVCSVAKGRVWAHIK